MFFLLFAVRLFVSSFSLGCSFALFCVFLQTHNKFYFILFLQRNRKTNKRSTKRKEKCCVCVWMRQKIIFYYYCFRFICYRWKMKMKKKKRKTTKHNIEFECIILLICCLVVWNLSLYWSKGSHQIYIGIVHRVLHIVMSFHLSHLIKLLILLYAFFSVSFWLNLDK